MKRIALTLLCYISGMSWNAFAESASQKSVPKELAAYDMTWTTPSTGSQESMPLSGGILGLNVWVENGDIGFLIGSPNCLDEEGRQVKLGLLRLHLFQPIVKDFKQKLHLAQSEIVITGETESGASVHVKLWCGV